MALVKNRTGRPRARRSVSIKPMPFGGDHGTGTAAAKIGTKIEPIDAKSNPNHIGRRRRVEVIGTLSLTLRQDQAARAIRDAYCRVEMLSSGGEIKERVQSSPKPDANVAMQMGVQSTYIHIMRGVRSVDRPIIEHVCFNNQPLRTFKGHGRQSARLAQALDVVADYMGY